MHCSSHDANRPPQSLRVRGITGPVGRTITVATPVYDGKATAPFVYSMLRLQRICTRVGITLRWITLDGVIVDRAREALAALFMSRPQHFGDVLVYIDADEAWPARAVFDVVRLAHRLDVVAAAVPIKGRSWRHVWRAARLIQEADAEDVLPAVSSVARAFIPAGNAVSLIEPFECKDVGTGFLAVHRRVFERITTAHPELAYTLQPDELPATAWFWPIIEDGFRRPEDYSFCSRWRALGGKAWAIAWHNIVHTGPEHFVDDAALHAELGVPLDSRNDAPPWCELVAPSDLTPPHGANPRKAATLAESMRAHGWNDRPLLVVRFGDRLQALTGSHRIAAAKIAAIEAVPCHVVDLRDRPELASSIESMRGGWRALGDPTTCALLCGEAAALLVRLG